MAKVDDAGAMGPWTLRHGDRVIMEMPRLALAVYLRLLDVPLPSVYGPTADENPFG